MTSHTAKPIITIHILPNISRSKGNQTMKCGQLIEYNMRNIFLGKSYTKGGRETSPRPFYEKSKLSIHSVHWGINPTPQKHPPSANCPTPLLFRQSPPYILYFFIHNPSYLLKVTKFIVIVIILSCDREKHFCLETFLSLNISDFSLFSCKNCNPPPMKRSPLFPSNSTLKIEVLLSPPF